MMHKKQQKGFTLTEVMIVVAIVAIIALVAFPNYQEQVAKTKRTLAKAALAEMQSRQQNYFLDRKAYAATLDLIGYPINGGVTYMDDNGNFSSSDANSIYAFSFQSAPTNTYFEIYAEPDNNYTDSKCGRLLLSSTNKKGSNGVSGNDSAGCW